MAIKKKWRRELTPGEKRVDFKRLEEQWVSAETALVEDLVPVLVQAIGRLETDLRKILDSGDYNGFKELKIGYKDKLAMVFKTHMFDAFKMGKAGVYSEFKVQKDVALDAFARELMGVRAEATVNDLLDKMKSHVVFTALSGIKAGLTTDQIVAEVKGKPFKEQQAEPVKA